MSETVELLDSSTGRWRVITEGSAYLVDLDARTLIRQPGQGSDGLTGRLRRDGDPVPLARVVQLRVGQPAMLVLDIRGDGIATVRHTSLVVDIQPAEVAQHPPGSGSVRSPLQPGFFSAMPEPIRGRLESGWAKWVTWCDEHGIHPVQADVGQVVDHLLDRRNAEAGREYGSDEDDVVDGLDAISAVLRYRAVNPIRSDPRLHELRGQL